MRRKAKRSARGGFAAEQWVVAAGSVSSGSPPTAARGFPGLQSRELPVNESAWTGTTPGIRSLPATTSAEPLGAERSAAAGLVGRGGGGLRTNDRRGRASEILACRRAHVRSRFDHHRIPLARAPAPAGRCGQCCRPVRFKADPSARHQDSFSMMELLHMSGVCDLSTLSN